MKNTQENPLFETACKKIAHGVGRPIAFQMALLIVAVWGALGPFFQYSDTWQLVINTGTTIITFLMVFLIQNTQNRDMEALQIKLDELIRVTKGARNSLLDLEELDDESLCKIQNQFQQLARKHQRECKT